ncbi:MAG TPA: DUF2478 domain-containing protein, partial [Polyangiales bacterium]
MSPTEASAARRMAAIVYDEGVAIDLLLHVFAETLSARSVRLGGVLSVPGVEPQCGPEQLLHLQDLRSGELIRVCYRLEMDTGDAACRLDCEALSRAVTSIRLARERGAQLVFVPRFGNQELQGGGFRNAFQQGGASSCAVLTAVPRVLVDRWLAFTRGACTLLAPSLGGLQAWWAANEGQPHAAQRVENV